MAKDANGVTALADAPSNEAFSRHLFGSAVSGPVRLPDSATVSSAMLPQRINALSAL